MSSETNSEDRVVVSRPRVDVSPGESRRLTCDVCPLVSNELSVEAAIEVAVDLASPECSVSVGV